jgi:hypothetical protein
MIAIRFRPMASAEGTDGVELYEFPAQRDVPQLGWLGPDYTSAVVSNLGAGLREQDAGTELIAVKCEAPPQLEATVKGSGPREVVSGQQARFDLQVLVRDGNGQHWRLRGRMTCTGDRLDTDEPAVGVTFDLASAEAV